MLKWKYPAKVLFFFDIYKYLFVIRSEEFFAICVLKHLLESLHIEAVRKSH